MVRWRGSMLVVSLLANAWMGLRLQQLLPLQGQTDAPSAQSSPQATRAARLPSAAPARIPDAEVGAPLRVAAGALTAEHASEAASTPRAEESEATRPAVNLRELQSGGLSGAESRPEPSDGSQQRRRSRDPLERFDEARLRGMGLGEREIASYRNRMENMRADVLRAQDDALRDGQSRSDGARMLRVAGDRAWSELRQDFGDDVYDTLLYATHQTNRAQVVDVVDGSPAAAAGFRKGDIIVYYDRERVFSPADLSSASHNRPGRETVLVEVQRGPQLLELYVPRGKMGVRLEARSLPPQQP